MAGRLRWLGTALACAALAACGEQELPADGAAYRALSRSDRLRAATICRDRAADHAGGRAADQLEHASPDALRAQLDVTLTVAGARRKTLTALCSDRLPFVTPVRRVMFDGATNSGDAYTFQTRSTRPLTIRGTVSPAPAGGYVVARREFARSTPFQAPIHEDGSFTLPTVKLRHQANNSFVVAFHAPRDAVQKVRFSAICLDCLSAG
jgi:hypothetical protein